MVINFQQVVNDIKRLHAKGMTEVEKRFTIRMYIFFCTTIHVPQIDTAVINDPVTFERNFETAVKYFLTFIDDE